jgi:predicted Zn-dependent protease
MRATAHRREQIALAQARRSAYPDAVELLYLAWTDYNAARSEADLDRASARFEAVLSKDPTSVFARVGRSVACLQTFNRLHSAAPDVCLDVCERQIRELYAMAPENLDAMQAMGGLLTWRGKPDEAMFLLRKSLEFAPSHRMGSAMMASVLVKQGRFDEAAPYIRTTREWAERRTEHGLSDQRRQAYFYQLFADAAFLQGREDEAAAWLRRWAAEMPDNGRPYLMLAAIDALHDRADEAGVNMARHRELLPRSTVRYVGMLYPTPNPQAIADRRARLIDGLRKAGLPEGA